MAGMLASEPKQVGVVVSCNLSYLVALALGP